MTNCKQLFIHFDFHKLSLDKHMEDDTQYTNVNPAGVVS